MDEIDIVKPRRAESGEPEMLVASGVFLTDDPLSDPSTTPSQNERIDIPERVVEMGVNACVNTLSVMLGFTETEVLVVLATAYEAVSQRSGIQLNMAPPQHAQS